MQFVTDPGDQNGEFTPDEDSQKGKDHKGDKTLVECTTISDWHYWHLYLIIGRGY